MSSRSLAIRNRFEDTVVDAAVFVCMFSVTVAIVFPFWTLLVDSFSSMRFSNLIGVKLLPLEPSLQSYQLVLSQPILATAYANTIMRTAAGTVLTVAVTLLAAYPLSKRTLPLKRTITALIVITMFFNGGLIPTYLVVRNLGLLNTRWAWILPILVSPFALIIMRNFLYSIPREIEESAYIDGAHDMTILWRIVLPLSLPIVATVSLWTAVQHWNEWFLAMIYVQDNAKLILQLLLRRVLVEDQELFEDDLAMVVSASSVRAATLFVSIGPIILIYPFIQRYFVKGVKLGGVKE